MATATICPVGHLCYYIMAQIWSTDQEALEKEGSQMAVCCHHGYLLHCSLLRSGELRGRVMSRTGLHEVFRCQKPAFSLHFSQGPQILPEHGLYTKLCSARVRAVNQAVLRSTTHFTCTCDVHGLNTCHAVGQEMSPSLP